MFQIQVCQPWLSPAARPPGLFDLSVNLVKNKMRNYRKMVFMPPVLELVEDMKTWCFFFIKRQYPIIMFPALIYCFVH